MKFLILIVSFFYSFANEAAEKTSLQSYVDQITTGISDASKQVDTLIQGWQTRIDTVTKSLQTVSGYDQTMIRTKIESLQKLIGTQKSMALAALQAAADAANKAAKNILNQVQQKSLNETTAKTQFNVTISQLRTSQNSALKTLQTAIEPELLSIESSVVKLSGQQQVQQQTQQAQTAQEQQKKYKMTIAELLKGLAKVSPQVDAATKDATALLLSYMNTGKVDIKKIAAVTQKYDQALKSLYDVYNKVGFTIDFADRSNLISNTIRLVINLYLRDIAVTQSKAQTALKKGSRENYHLLLAGLVERMLGTGKNGSLLTKSGYGAVINDFATRYVQVNGSQALTEYQTVQAQAVVDIYPDALQDLVNMGDPTQQHLLFATAYYSVIQAVIHVVPDQQAQALQQLVATNVAVLYALHGQQSIKSMVAGKDNKPLLNQAITDYQQAVNYFKQAQQNDKIQQYQSLAALLQQAATERDQANTAQNQSDKTSAIHFYQQAYQDFLNAGDEVDAQEMNVLSHRVQAQQFVQQAQQLLQNFITQNKNQLESYLNVINSATPPITQELTTYDSLFSSLIAVLPQAIDLYNQAIGNYQESNDATSIIEQAVTFLTSVKNGLSQQAQAEVVARGARVDSLASAQSLYTQAHMAFASSDNAYQTNSSLASFVIHPQQFTDAKTLNYSIMLERHKARNYIEVASTLSNDAATALQYYSDAASSNLSTEVSTYLSSAIAKLSGVQTSLEQMLTNAQQMEDALKNQSASAWSSADPNIYTSNADSQWQTVVKAYALAWRTSGTPAYSSLINALGTYVRDYLTKVPAQFFPEIGAALLYEALYIVAHENQDVSTSGAALTSMEEVVKTAFKRVQQLLKTVNSSTQSSVVSDSLQKIVNWVQRMELALTQQQDNITNYVRSGSTSYALLNKTTDNSGNSTYSMQTSGSTIATVTIPNLDLLSAQIAQKLGDAFFAQQQYIQAYPQYQQAQKIYEKLGMTDQVTAMKNKYDITLTRATAQFYKNSIIPNDSDSHGIKMVTVAGMQMPERFEFYQYSQKIPTYIPIAATLQDLARSQDQQSMQAAIDSLLQYAYLLFVDNMLSDYGIAYSNVFNGWQQLSTPNITDDQRSSVQTVLSEAYFFEQGLKARVQAGLSSLVIKVVKDSNGADVFYLTERYKPIPVLPLPGISATSVPYRSFPTVDNYYNAAQSLVDPQKPTIQIHDKVYVSGNDPQFQLSVQQLRAKALISAGNLYQKRVPYLVDGTAFTDPTQSADEITNLQTMQKLMQQLKAVNLQDMNVQMTTFLPAYNLIKSYLHDITLVYYDQSQYLFSQLNMNDPVKALTILKADTVVQLADTARMFLVGDPRSTDYFWGSQGNYGGLLSEIKDTYMLAVSLYQNAGVTTDTIAGLFSKGAQLFINAGDIMVAQANYPAAITYYGMAIGAYKGSPTPNPTQLNQTMLKWLNACYKSAITSVMTYRTAALNPIPITLSNGEQESISLQDLLARAITGDPQELATLSSIKNTILDAFIYFKTCSSAIEIFLGDQSSQQTIVQAGADFIKKFSSDKKIDVSSFDAILQWFTRTDFEQTLQDFFDSSAQYISNVDTQKQKIGYSALDQWCTLMYYTVLSSLYTHDFSQTVADLQQAIQFEQNEMLAPADQWIG